MPPSECAIIIITAVNVQQSVACSLSMESSAQALLREDEVPLLLQFISFHLNLSFILKCRSEEAAPLGPFGLFCAELWLCQYVSLAPLWGVAEQQELLLEQPLRRVGQSLPSLKTALGKERHGFTHP